MKIIQHIESFLLHYNFNVSSKSISKPWGAYLLVKENQSNKFLNFFFDKKFINKVSLNDKLTPKILIIKPKIRLSWQYHERRSEIWSVIKGSILVSKSENNSECDQIELKKNDQIEIGKKIRHRIIGTEDYALVAEIWIHTDKNNPSDEKDIIRLQDDFNRN